jgi:U4/U6.U5 tri-snRNP-associated protein 1
MGELVTNKHYDYTETANLVDDEDLQSMLSAARLKAIRKQIKIVPSLDEVDEDLGQSVVIKEEPIAGGLVFDETSEFVRGLNQSGLFDQDERAAKTEPGLLDGAVSSIKPEPLSSTHDLAEIPLNDEMELDKVKSEEGMISSSESRAGSVEAEYHNPLEDEPSLNLGVGAAMELFKKRGNNAEFTCLEGERHPFVTLCSLTQ